MDSNHMLRTCFGYTGALYVHHPVIRGCIERVHMAQTPEATVVFGVFNETSEHESRVALTPDIATRLRKAGVSCLIEHGAGEAASYTDDDYAKAGVTVTDKQTILDEADALGFVDRPSEQMITQISKGTWVIGMLGSFTDEAYVSALQQAGLTAIAIERLPRQLSSAQSMDEMTSQNSVMGYKAVLVAANEYGSFLPSSSSAGTNHIHWPPPERPCSP